MVEHVLEDTPKLANVQQDSRDQDVSMVSPNTGTMLTKPKR